MTRFVGDAIGVRGRAASAYTKKDLRKNMEKFIQTGVHPDIEQAQRKALESYIPPLPDHDPNRDFVFLELKSGNTALGRLVIELFSDVVPVGANHLRQRCLPGSKTGLKGTAVHKLQAHYAFWLGKNPAASEGMHLPANTSLRHGDAGAVSISWNGDEVAISLGRALVLDQTHQVVGRVHVGKELLEKLDDVATDHLDVPIRKLTVSLCGATNAAGSFEEIGQGGAAGASKNPLERLAEQSQDARDSVLEALAVGLGQKRKAGDSDAGAGAGSSSGSKEAARAADKTPRQGIGAGRRNVKAKVMDAMLGDLSDDDDDSDGSED